jgi:nucleoside-diphosphate-sugar epimerase/ketosteroid isomerase-like protein
MRVFVAGASGAIGSRLVPQLIDAGHEVIGTHTSASSGARVAALGATPVALDLLDADAVRKGVLEAAPDAIVHQATALANARFDRNFDRSFAQTNRLRTEGTDNLLAAAREAGVSRFVAQSNVTFRYAREGGMVKSEDDPLDTRPVAGAVESRAAMNYLDAAVVAAGGIALRYGIFYGAANDGLVGPVRKRQLPIVGDGEGVTSWIHLDDAAAATVLALEHDGRVIYNIVDDEPAPAREWLPVLADALGGKPPRHVPVWLARLFAGEPGVVMGTEARGASNARAKHELGWHLRYPSWRKGFVAVYAPQRPSTSESAMPASRDTEAISLAFASYLEAFQTLDANAAAAYCHTPCMLVAPQGVQVMASTAEVSGMFDRMMAGLRARGYARSKLTDLHVEPMSESAAVVSVSRTRQAADGQDLERVGETYVLRRTDAGWKIVMALMHDPHVTLRRA